MLLGLLASAALAVATPLAPVPANTPVSAYDGYVVWSRPRPDETRWVLMQWHDGVTTPLTVPASYTPFDADVGPDARGRPTVTYTRCQVDVTQPCGLAALTLSRPGTGERLIAVPRPPRGSGYATPSVWRDRIAFRRVPSHGPNQLMVYDFSNHRLTTLRHGTVEAGDGVVERLDLGAKSVAFSWRFDGKDVLGTGPAWELWGERLADRRMVLAGSGYVSGACGGRSTLDPNATAGGVEFLSLINHCGTPEGVVTSTTFASGGLLSRTEDVGGGTATRIARDAATGTTYAVVGGQLVRVGGLKLQPTGRRATSSARG